MCVASAVKLNRSKVQQPRQERAATAQQTHSDRDGAANAQQAHSNRRCMKRLCWIEIHTDMHVHICMYGARKYSHIHTDMYCLGNAYVYVCASMSAESSRHTWTYALDTAPMNQDTYNLLQIQSSTGRYKSVHIMYTLCICNIHSVVSFAHI